MMSDVESTAASSCCTPRTPRKSLQQYESKCDDIITMMKGSSNPLLSASNSSCASMLSAFESELSSDVLKNAIFVGHINTDLDSVAGAIAGATLFDGIPAISEKKLNGEILFALQQCGIEIPTLFTDIEGYESKKICLVDHTEKKQMVPYIRENLSQVVGVIDHHALASSFHTEQPIFMDIRPWGCMCTILTHKYISLGKPIPDHIAKLMMSAILSDTLNLKSPTTTKADQFAICLLSSLIELPDVTEYAMSMFQAKTEYICGLGAEAMTSADAKEFEAHGKLFGIAVLEIAGTPQPVLNLKNEIINCMIKTREEKNMDYFFLFIVDVVSQTSVMISCGDKESKICDKSFPECQFREENAINVGNYASRKKQLFPMIQNGLKAYLN